VTAPSYWVQHGILAPRPEKAIRELIVPRANYGEARDVQEVAASGGMVAAEFARRDRVCAWALKWS
jgi:hypothetical protein